MIVASVGNTADDGVVAVGFDAVGFDAVGFDAACIRGEGRNACGAPWRRTRR